MSHLVTYVLSSPLVPEDETECMRSERMGKPRSCGVEHMCEGAQRCRWPASGMGHKHISSVMSIAMLTRRRGGIRLRGAASLTQSHATDARLQIAGKGGQKKEVGDSMSMLSRNAYTSHRHLLTVT